MGECQWGFDVTLYNAIKDFPGMVAIAAGNFKSEHTDQFGVSPADFATDTLCRSGLDNVISVAGSSPWDTRHDWWQG